MRQRKDILSDLLEFNSPLNGIQEELNRYPWDIEEPLIILAKRHIVSTLQKAVNGILSFEEIENWANAIECREDIEFENEKVKEIIFELANPELHSKLTIERLKRTIQSL
jgi:hypothetical protein